MNKEKLLIILGSILALGVCSEKEDLSPKTEVNMDQVQTDKSALETEIEDLLEEDVELVMTSISLDEYMKDSEENINYSTGDQKYLSPSREKVLTFNVDNSTLQIATIVDGYLCEPIEIDLTNYFYSEEYYGRLINAGWYNDEEIFITTNLELLIHNLVDGKDTLISSDFRTTFDEFGTFKFIDWLTPPIKLGII